MLKKQRGKQNKHRTGGNKKNSKLPSLNLNVQQPVIPGTGQPRAEKRIAAVEEPVTTSNTDTYTHVNKELKEIALLTVIMLGLLCIAALLWR